MYDRGYPGRKPGSRPITEFLLPKSASSSSPSHPAFSISVRFHLPYRPRPPCTDRGNVSRQQAFYTRWTSGTQSRSWGFSMEAVDFFIFNASAISAAGACDCWCRVALGNCEKLCFFFHPKLSNHFSAARYDSFNPPKHIHVLLHAFSFKSPSVSRYSHSPFSETRFDDLSFRFVRSPSPATNRIPNSVPFLRSVFLALQLIQPLFLFFRTHILKSPPYSTQYR